MRHQVMLILSILLLTSGLMIGCSGEDIIKPTPTQPFVAITYPADLFQLTGPDTIRALANDPDGIASVSFLVDGIVTYVDDTPPYSWFWNTDYWVDADQYTLTLVALDAVGDLAATDPIVIRMPVFSFGPVLVSPTIETDIDLGDVTFNWRSFPGASEYELDIALFDPQKAIDTTLTVTDTTATVTLLEDGHGRWMVRALDADGHRSRWSQDHSITVGNPSFYQFPATVEILMDNFEVAYTRLDAAGYRDLLDTRFQFYYTDDTDHDYATEVRIIENMLSGNPPTNPGPFGGFNGIRSIEVDKLLPLEAWENVSASHPDFGGIPGAKRGFYDLNFIFHHDAGTITISSAQFFYAVPVQTVVDGTVRTAWKLLGQTDLLVSLQLADEGMSWSQLKSLFL